MGKYSMGTVELLREQLRVHEQNLAKLELQAARHGMDVPLALQNQIDFEVQKIEELRKRLARAEAGPSAVKEEMAVPLWQKVPVWAWGAIGGVVLLIAIVGAFLAGRVSEPVPTPTVVAEVTTPNATSAAMPQPTATPVAPTSTPVPPTDTPVPTPTPRPTPTPTPTMEADPTVYDNLNNPTSGGYNRDLWTMFSQPGGQCQIVQQDGAMMFTQQGKPEKGTGLATLKSISLDRPTFFEARLMLSSEVNAGNVGLQIGVDFSPNESWYAECRVYQEDGKAWAVCSEKFWSQQEEWYYDSEPILVQLGSWHIVRIEVDPATMTFNYFINRQLVGSHIPRVADRLKKARFRLNMGIWGPSPDAVTGYVDDVRIGPVQ